MPETATISQPLQAMASRLPTSPKKTTLPANFLLDLPTPTKNLLLYYKIMRGILYEQKRIKTKGAKI